ncbi:hypothetical protein ACFWBR_38450 [Streptomyces sp. NPDC060006]|uniref:hypothetical protein n=1 Tax=unclassified Streptomyces TaxID=2593676 RepID=UPI0036BCB60B
MACHTDRWLRGALLSGQAERTWELAQHATALVGHIRSTHTADGYTALLMGNLAAFHHAHGQYDAAHSLLELEWLGRARAPLDRSTRSAFAVAGCREIHPYPRLVVPRTHSAYDEVNRHPQRRQLLGESLHSRLALTANQVQ